jgi:hypothetical protein
MQTANGSKMTKFDLLRIEEPSAHNTHQLSPFGDAYIVLLSAGQTGPFVVKPLLMIGAGTVVVKLGKREL